MLTPRLQSAAYSIFYLILGYSFSDEVVNNHDELMSNFFAQPDALAYGKVRHFFYFLQYTHRPPHTCLVKIRKYISFN